MATFYLFGPRASRSKEFAILAAGNKPNAEPALSVAEVPPADPNRLRNSRRVTNLGINFSLKEAISIFDAISSDRSSIIILISGF